MPPTTSGSCATSRCAAFFAFSAESPASIATSSSLAPPIDLMPPSSLISSMAVSAPHFTSVPWRAQGPLSGAITATLIGLGWARSMRHGIDVVASVAAPSAPCLMIVRLVVFMASSVSLAADLHSKISAPHAFVRHQRLVRPFHRDAAGLQHVAVVAGLQRLGDALLDQQDRQSVRDGSDGCARRSRPRSSAQVPSRARRASAGPARTQARGRSPASAARRPRACRRAGRAARARIGNSCRIIGSVSPKRCWPLRV